MKNINIKTLLLLGTFITTITIKTASKEEIFEGSDEVEIPLVATFDNENFHNGRIRSIACSPNKTVALADGLGIMRIYDINTQELITSIDTDQRLTNALAFSPDGKFIAAGTTKNTIVIYDVETKECINTLGEPTVDNVLAQHGFNIIVFSDDSRFLTAGCLKYPEGHIKLWEKNGDETYSPIDLQNKKLSTYWVYALAFNPDGNILGVSSIKQGKNDPSATTDITMWNTSTGKTKAVIDLNHFDESIPTSLTFNPDKSLMSEQQNEVKIWRPSNKNNYECSKHFEFKENERSYPWTVLPSAISHSGQLFAGCFRNEFIELWDVNTRQHLASLEPLNKKAINFIFSPDENYFLVQFKDTSVKIFDISALNFDRKLYD